MRRASWKPSAANAAIVIFCFVGMLQPGGGLAQEYGGFHAADTSSPRDTLRSFIDACNETNHLVEKNKFVDRRSDECLEIRMRIIDCIDARELPAFARVARSGEVAACLKEILDRVEIPPWEDILGKEEIAAAGGLEQLSRWRIPGTRITIARIEEGPQKHEYLFSTGTVDRAVEYFKSIEFRPYRTSGPEVSPDLYQWYISAPGHPVLGKIVSHLPAKIQFGRTAGLSNWKWPGLILIVLIVIAVMAICYKLQYKFTARTKGKSAVKYCLTIVFPIIAMLAPWYLKYVAERFLTIRDDPLYLISFMANLTFVLASIVVVFSAAGRIAELIIASPRINPQGLNAQLIRIVSKLVSRGCLYLGGSVSRHRDWNAARQCRHRRYRNCSRCAGHPEKPVRHADADGRQAVPRR